MRARTALLLVFAALACAACSVPQIRADADAQALMPDPQRLVVVTVANPPAAGIHGAGSTWRGWDLGGGYDVTADVQGAVQELSSRYDLAAVDSWPIALLGVHCVVFRMQGAETREALLRRLQADPRVESAQPLHEFNTAGAELPPAELQYSVKAMQLEPAHRWAQGRGVRVAIVDTGVDFDHPELAGRVLRHIDFVGRPEARFASERHGTAVAGVIAASMDDAQGIVGVAPRAELIALKACWPVTAGAAEARCNSFTLARALAAAVELKSDVLNLSLAGPPDPLLARLVRAAVDRGILVVGALPEDAGSRPEAYASFPAGVDGVIAVRSLGAPEAAGRHSVSAPGEDIISLAPGAAYQLQTGSSFAAAHVSGVAALLRELSRGLRPAELERLLLQSSRPAGDASPAEAPGVNACQAVSQLRSGVSCPAAGS